VPVTSTFQTTQGTQAGQQSGTSTTQAQSPALTAKQNLSAVPDLASLTALINGINQNAQTNANAARLPGGAALLAQQSANIGTGLSGQLDPSVVAMLQQQAAELGAGRGMAPGAASTNAAYLRALGLTATQRQDTASQQLNAALGANPGAPLFNPAQFLVTPSQAGTTTTTQGANTGQNASQSSGSTVYPDQPAPVSFPSAPTHQPNNPAAADSTWLDSLFGGTGSTSPFSQAQWWNAIGYGQPTIGGATLSGLSPGVTGSEFDNLFSDTGDATLSGLSPGVTGSEFDNLFSDL